MHKFLEIIGIVVLSVVAIVVLIVMLRAGFHGPHYDQDKIKTKFNIFHVEKEEQQEALKEKKYAYAKWTPAADDKLRKLYIEEKYSISKLSRYFCRSKGAIKSRLKRLELQ